MLDKVGLLGRTTDVVLRIRKKAVQLDMIVIRQAGGICRAVAGRSAPVEEEWLLAEVNSWVLDLFKRIPGNSNAIWTIVCNSHLDRLGCAVDHFIAVVKAWCSVGAGQGKEKQPRMHVGRFSRSPFDALGKTLPASLAFCIV